MGIHSAQEAFTRVLDYAGASLKRDAVDGRIARETRSGSYTYEGSKGSTKGFIDTQSDVGGWPAYSGTAQADSDGDGIPDAVEDAWGLNKASAADGAAVSLDKHGRYSNLEMYLHYLVREIVSGAGAGAAYRHIK